MSPPKPVGMLVAFVLVAVACGGGGGGGSASGPAATPMDVSGRWNVEETPITSGCAWGLEYFAPYEGSISQSGASLVLTTPKGTFTGVLQGTVLTMEGSFADHGGWTTLTYANFAVTPFEMTGTASWTYAGSQGGPVVCQGTTDVHATKIDLPPVLDGHVRFTDVDGNHAADAGDRVIVGFSEDVVLRSSSPSCLDLPVTGDSFGAGAHLEAGPASNEITVVLGSSPHLTVTGAYRPGVHGAGSPSGLGVAPTLPPDAITSLVGVDATSHGLALSDVAPAFVEAAPASAADAAHIVLADLDGDRDLDLITVGTVLVAGHAPCRIALNDGNGHFTDTGQSNIFIVPWIDSAPQVGDLDGDRDADLFFASYTTEASALWLNDGTGHFTLSPQTISGGIRSPVLADIDRDGDLDVLAVTWDAPAVVEFLNDGSGAFGPLRGIFPTTGPFRVHDWDQDGALDLITPGLIGVNDGSGLVFMPIGTNTSSMWPPYADLDGDTIAEPMQSVYTGSGYSLSVEFSDGSHVVMPRSLPRWGELVVADVDGDGVPEVLDLSRDAPLAAVWMSSAPHDYDPYVGFAGPLIPGSASSFTAWAAGDIDGNGRVDLLVSTGGTGVRVLRDSSAR